MVKDSSTLNKAYEIKKFLTKEEVFEYSYSLLNNLKYTKEKPIVIVPGGTSPRDFFKLLLTKNYDWTQIEFLLSDERLVDINSSKSNFRQINDLFLNKLDHDRRPNLFPKMDKLKTIDKKEILFYMNKRYENLPTISIAFLGIGDDGHTASIFGDDKFDKKKTPFFLTKRLVEKFSRISISTNYLCSAKKIVFFLIGKKKKRLLEMIGKNEIDIPVNEIINNAKLKQI